MNHHYTEQSEDECTHRNSSATSKNLSSEELMKQTRRFTLDMFKIQNSATALIAEPEEIPTETIKMDPTGSVTVGKWWLQNTQEAGGRDPQTVQDNVLNNTNSGIDLPMVRSLLGKEQHKATSQNAVPVTTDASVTIECAISNEKFCPVMGSRINETTDFSMLETIQTTGNVSSQIGNEMPYNNKELEDMKNPANYNNNFGSSYVPVTVEAEVGENHYETNSHVFDCYIENDRSGMHNQANNQYLESEQSFSGAVTEDMSEDADLNTRGSFFGLLRKKNETLELLNKSIRQMVRDYPLLSDHELFEQMKDTDPFISLKLNKKRLVKVLGRLKLGSGYERFRFFVKA